MSGRAWPLGLTRRSLRVRFYILLLCLDVFCLFLGLLAGGPISGQDMSASETIKSVGILIPFFAFTAFNQAAYSISALRRPQQGLRRVLTALAYTMAIFILAFYFFGVKAPLLRTQLLSGGIAAAVLLTIERLWVGRMLSRAYGQDYVSTLLLRDQVDIPCLDNCRLIDAQALGLRADTRDPMMLDRIAKAFRGIDRVIVACKPQMKRQWATILKGANVRGEIVSENFDALGAIALDNYDGRVTLVVSTGPLNLHNRVIKRTFDLALCVPALILLAPVYVMTAIAIKLDSPGPVFFRQKRVGRGNEMFEILKFRSMRQDLADAEGKRSAHRDDDRITAVGSVIRRLSIDELPQLLNVLFGSMSLVGPRPHALGSLAGDSLFWEVDERYWHRHTLKPGITGLAQVRGLRGATHERSDLTQRLQSDLEYISGWSIWRDVAILVGTFRVILHKNAY